MKKFFLLCILISVNATSAATVGLTWYDNGTTISDASSCTVGGTFTPPIPTKTGYVFAGWKIKEIHEPTCAQRIQDLDYTIGITKYDQYNCSYIQLDGTRSSVASYFGLTTPGQWASKQSYGTIYGVARSSTTSGNNSSYTFPQSSQSNWLKQNPSTTRGNYCWCQITGFAPAGSNYSQGPQCTVTPASSWWVFYMNVGYTNCAYQCGCSGGGYKADFRRVAFAATGL